MPIDLKSLPENLQKQIVQKMNEAEGRKGGKIPVPPPEPKKNKLNAEKCGGYDSKREERRAAELRLMQMGGKISNLREQVPYLLIPAIYKTEDGHLIENVHEKPKKELEKEFGKLTLVERSVVYVADFVYKKDGKTVVEDAKGFKDPSSAVYAKFVLKRKLMLYIHGIEVREV